MLDSFHGALYFTDIVLRGSDATQLRSGGTQCSAIHPMSNARPVARQRSAKYKILKS